MESTTSKIAFHPFPRLPEELRLKIWRLSLPGPRLIRISMNEDNDFFSNATPPIGLQICRESRDETLRFYKLCFAVDPSNTRIYISTEYDALQLPNSHSFTAEGLTTFWELFTRATADVRNDIKAACVDNCWLFTRFLTNLRTDGAQPVLQPLFGPACRLFLFQEGSELLPFRHTVWVPIQSTGSGLEGVSRLFGTSKITSIMHVESQTNRTHEAMIPRIPLSDQDWTTNFDGFGSVVRQYIETTLLKGRKSCWSS